MINLTHLGYIIEIAERGSINLAAQNLFVSQPYLSKIVKLLEKELGIIIFDRNNTGVVPTELGEQLLRIAKTVIREIERAYELNQSIELNDGISIVTTFSSFLMRSFLTFKKSYNNSLVQDSIRETSIRQTIIDITTGAYRLAFITCNSDRVDYYAGIATNHHLKLITLKSNIPLAVLMSNSHPLAECNILHLDEIRNYNLVCYNNYPFEDLFGNNWILQEEQVFYVYDRGGLIDTVKEENFLAPIMQDSDAIIGLNNLIEIPIAEMSTSLCVCLIYPRSYELSRREIEFVNFFKTKLIEAYC